MKNGGPRRPGPPAPAAAAPRPAPRDRGSGRPPPRTGPGPSPPPPVPLRQKGPGVVLPAPGEEVGAGGPPVLLQLRGVQGLQLRPGPAQEQAAEDGLTGDLQPVQPQQVLPVQQGPEDPLGLLHRPLLQPPTRRLHGGGRREGVAPAVRRRQGEPLLRHIGGGPPLHQGGVDPQLAGILLQGRRVLPQILGVIAVVAHPARLHGHQAGHGQPDPQQDQGSEKHLGRRGLRLEKERQGQGGQQQVGQPPAPVVQPVGHRRSLRRGHETLSPGAGDVIAAQPPPALHPGRHDPADPIEHQPVAGEQTAHQMAPLVDHDLDQIGQGRQGQDQQQMAGLGQSLPAHGVRPAHGPIAQHRPHQSGGQGHQEGLPGDLFFLSHIQVLPHRGKGRPQGPPHHS